MADIEGIPATPPARKAAAQARRDWAQTERETEIAHNLSEATAKAIVARARARYGHDDPNAEATKRVLTSALHCATSSPLADPLPDTETALEEANQTQWRVSARIGHYFLNQLGRIPPFTLLRDGRYHDPNGGKDSKGDGGLILDDVKA